MPASQWQGIGLLTSLTLWRWSHAACRHPEPGDLQGCLAAGPASLGCGSRQVTSGTVCWCCRGEVPAAGQRTLVLPAAEGRLCLQQGTYLQGTQHAQ